MAISYKKMRKISQKLIGDNGAPFVLRHPDGQSVYDPITDTSTRSYIDYTGKCIRKVYSAEAIGESESIIKAGDVEFVCVFDDLTVEPTEQTDKILFADKEYNILHSLEINPNGQMPIAFRLHTRKAG